MRTKGLNIRNKVQQSYRPGEAEEKISEPEDKFLKSLTQTKSQEEMGKTNVELKNCDFNKRPSKRVLGVPGAVERMSWKVCL